MKRILIISLFFWCQQVTAQCDLAFTVFDYNGYGVSCHGMCDGGVNTTASGISPFTFIWSSGETTQNLQSMCPGVYVLTMTDNTGCTVIDSIEITEPTELVANINVITPIQYNSICDGNISGNANGGVPGYTFEWYNCDNGQIFSVWDPLSGLCSGNYGLSVIDLNGCSDTTCVMLEEDSCAFVSQNYGLGGLDCSWGVLSSNFPIDSYQWVNCDDLYSPFIGDTNEMYSSSYDGNVAVIIEMLGCVDTSFCNDICYWGIDEISFDKKQLYKIVDMTGRETDDKPFTLLIYIYNDGTREKVFKIE